MIYGFYLHIKVLNTEAGKGESTRGVSTEWKDHIAIHHVLIS